MNYKYSRQTLPFSMLTPISKGILFVFLCFVNIALTYLFFIAPWFLGFESLDKSPFLYYLTFAIFVNFALLSIYVLCFFIGTLLPNNMHIKFIFGGLFYLSIFFIYIKISLLNSANFHQIYTDVGPMHPSDIENLSGMKILSVIRMIMLPVLMVSNLAFMNGQKISSHPYKFEKKKEILIALGISFAFFMIPIVMKAIFPIISP